MKEFDPILIQEIKNGNLKSFELVFKGFYSRLCAYAYGLVKDKDVASDLVKDFFVKWWENRDHFEIQTSLTGYLYKSVYHSCLNYRSRELKKHITSNESDLNVLLTDLNFSESDNYPMDKLITDEIEVILHRTIQNLPEQCREIFIMSRMEQLSHAEIATKLNIAPNTVKVQIYKVLLRLKEELKDYLTILLILLNSYFFK